ncbi:hypothetical protein [Chamaesiphon polymorphus]|uniref:Uncharacterized protein n=1 Tax=Chamaesiphon polymorphus CCALA 037 TaxID=2107692 RepID=A0A2T1GEG5_9CYAN|nr:hypothetical protein [Chamaesiphon polymorphus]PSB55858.1 hypothetical protein C7B77_13725 [Chamaesiphon polymorphus CCALA 037]
MRGGFLRMCFSQRFALLGKAEERESRQDRGYANEQFYFDRLKHDEIPTVRQATQSLGVKFNALFSPTNSIVWSQSK